MRLRDRHRLFFILGKLSIALVQEYKVSSFVMAYYEYRGTWTPFVEDVLECQLEPDNAVEKYVIAMNKDRVIWTLDESKKQDVCKDCPLFSESRCSQYDKNENK